MTDVWINYQVDGAETLSRSEPWMTFRQ